MDGTRSAIDRDWYEIQGNKKFTKRIGLETNLEEQFHYNHSLNRSVQKSKVKPLTR